MMFGSDIKMKYADQEAFIIKAIVAGWDTGNPISNSCSYNFLIYRFGHECEADQM